MLGAAAFMNWRGGLRTSQGIFWFAASGILGWPFAAALCAPYMVEELALFVFGDSTAKFESFLRIGRGVVGGLVLVVSLAFLHHVLLSLATTVIVPRFLRQPFLLQEGCRCSLEHCCIQRLLFYWRA